MHMNCVECNPKRTPDCNSVEMSNLQRCDGVTIHGCGNPAYNVYCWDHAHPVCHRPEPVAIQHLCAYLRKDEAAHIYTTKQETFDLQTIISHTYQTKEDAATMDQKIDQEIADRENGDTRLEGELQAQSVILEGIIQAEANRAKAAEQDLQNQLDQEVSRAEAAEQDLANAISAEEQRATDRENSLERAILAETVRATNRENELHNAINAEKNRAQVAEEGLQNNITAEKNRAQAAENALNTAVQANTSAIANEVSRAQSAENNIAAGVSALNTKVNTDLVHSADYDSANRQIQFKNSAGTVIDIIDASAFIKDGMVSNVVVVNGMLRITFNTDAGHSDINIPISSIFDANNYYTKQQSDGRYYTKAEIDALISSAISGIDMSNYYTKSQIDEKFVAA